MEVFEEGDAGSIHYRIPHPVSLLPCFLSFPSFQYFCHTLSWEAKAGDCAMDVRRGGRSSSRSSRSSSSSRSNSNSKLDFYSIFVVTKKGGR